MAMLVGAQRRRSPSYDRSWKSTRRRRKSSKHHANHSLRDAVAAAVCGRQRHLETAKRHFNEASILNTKDNASCRRRRNPSCSMDGVRQAAIEYRPRMLAIVGRCLATISLWAAVVSPALAQGETPSLRVATRVVSPLVIERNGQLTGFSIELWNSIADRIKVKTSYQIAPDISALLVAVRDNQADLGISAISIHRNAKWISTFRNRY